MTKNMDYIEKVESNILSTFQTLAKYKSNLPFEERCKTILVEKQPSTVRISRKIRFKRPGR